MELCEGTGVEEVKDAGHVLISAATSGHHQLLQQAEAGLPGLQVVYQSPRQARAAQLPEHTGVLGRIIAGWGRLPLPGPML